MNKTIVISNPDYIHSHCFDEIAEAFDQALPPTSKQIVFGSHLIKDMSEADYLRGRILYQSEQITSECYWVKPTYLEILRNHEVWDYSPENVRVLQKLGVNAKFVPIRYMPCMTKFKSLPDEKKDIDVLFYGSTNPRRLKILNRLKKAGMKVEKIFGVYGHVRDQVIARAKIVLNLHYFDSGIFEIFRCAHLFANEKCVVSETGRDKELDKMYQHNAAFCDGIDQIVDKCGELFDDHESRRAWECLTVEKFMKPTLKESL